jgi:hypothetical protein
MSAPVPMQRRRTDADLGGTAADAQSLPQQFLDLLAARVLAD